MLRSKGMTLYQRAHLHPVADIAKYEVKGSRVQWVDVSLDLSGFTSLRSQVEASVRQPSPTYIIFRRQPLAII